MTQQSGLEKALDHFLEHLDRERHYAGHTLEAYRRDLQQFARYLYPRLADARLPLAAVQRELVTGFLVELAERGRKPSTAARKLAAVRSFFRFLCREQVLAGNPARCVRAPQPEPRPSRSLPLSQVEEAIALPPATRFRGARDRAILEVFYGGGLCLSELVGLNLSALDLGEGTVRVMGRGRKERVVPVGSMALAALEAYLQQRANLLLDLDIVQVDAGALFLNGRGRRLHRRTVQSLVRRYLRQVAQGQSLSPHLLRHSYAAHLLEAGADPVAIGALLGQATPPGTRLHPQASLERLQQVYRQAHPRGR